MERPYVHLQPDEQALTIAASNIYAAYVVSGQAKDDPGSLKRAALEAIRLARMVDENVIAPGEAH